jgi:hypothetical protein
MIAEGADPRDVSWEVEQPSYRVYIWHQPPAPSEVSKEQVGYRCDEYRLRDASDIGDVLDWAHRTARPEQTFSLYVEHRDSDGLGLIQLAGTNPTVSR